jgi:hypothetical protein
MDTVKSIEIIESMLNEGRKSLHRNSFYYILWGLLMAPAGILESFLHGSVQNSWMVWPIAGIVGGIISFFYGRKESQKSGANTAVDRITVYTWGAFGFSLLFVIAFSLIQGFSPHTLVLLIAASATFISGGVLRFRPFVYGGIAIAVGAILCGFFVESAYEGYVFGFSLIAGYVIPGFTLRKSENG